MKTSITTITFEKKKIKASTGSKAKIAIFFP
jgi:hypothetical protein